MNLPVLVTRRTALKAAAAVAVGALARPRRSQAAGSHPETTHSLPGPLKLGVASISLRDLSVVEVIAVLRQMEIDRVSLFRSHAPFEKGTPEECAAAANACREGGIQVATSSVVYMQKDETAIRRAFENARAAGLKLMTCRPTPDSLPMVQEFVHEYDIKLAIHNHGPEGEFYPTPYEAMALIENMDERIGVCVDVGHTMRAGRDPAQTIRDCASRMYDVHLKDTLETVGAMRDSKPVEVGRGVMDIRSILEALIEVKFTGAVAFEYERTNGNPVTGLAESVGYVRGMLAAM
jgi:sugar phosphate isomerase/epimerase